MFLGTSQTCRGCRENFSLPGRGAAPHTLQSPNSLFHPTPQACASTPPASVSLCPLCAPLCSPKSAVPPFVSLCGSSCPSCFSKNIPPPPTTPPVAPQGRSVLRSLFSGHASAPWSFVLFVTAPQGKPSTGSPPPHPSRAAARSVFCSPFSVLWGGASAPPHLLWYTHGVTVS